MKKVLILISCALFIRSTVVAYTVRPVSATDFTGDIANKAHFYSDGFPHGDYALNDHTGSNPANDFYPDDFSKGYQPWYRGYGLNYDKGDWWSREHGSFRDYRPCFRSEGCPVESLYRKHTSSYRDHVSKGYASCSRTRK